MKRYAFLAEGFFIAIFHRRMANARSREESRRLHAFRYASVTLLAANVARVYAFVRSNVSIILDQPNATRLLPDAESHLSR
jgi:hypothetical protein